MVTEDLGGRIFARSKWLGLAGRTLRPEPVNGGAGASDGATETNYDRAKFAATGLVLVGLFRTASEFRPSALGKSDPRLVSHKAGCLGKAGFMECGLELYIRVSPVIALADNVWRHWTPALHVSFFLAPVFLRASRNRSYTADEDAG